MSWEWMNVSSHCSGHRRFQTFWTVFYDYLNTLWLFEHLLEYNKFATALVPTGVVRQLRKRSVLNRRGNMCRFCWIFEAALCIDYHYLSKYCTLWYLLNKQKLLLFKSIHPKHFTGYNFLQNQLLYGTMECVTMSARSYHTCSTVLNHGRNM